MASGSTRDPVVEKGMEIFERMGGERPSVFDRKSLSGRIMEAAMKDPDRKVRLFRFVDVFPTLTTSDLVTEHIREYFLDESAALPSVVKRIFSGAVSVLPAGLTASLLHRNILGFAKHFIAGENLEHAMGNLRRIWEEGRTVTVDILGEAAVSESEADQYLALYLSLADRLSTELAGRNSRDPARESRFPPMNISVKISSLSSRIGADHYEDSVRRVKERLRPIFRRVREAKGFVNVDMEMYGWKDITLDVFTGLLDEEEFRGWNGAGIALQTYLKDARRDIDRIVEWARDGRRRVGIRLVKGAYWEYENVVAGQKRWPVPVFDRKTHTDWNFERCAEAILENAEHVTLAAGTHNVRSIASVLIAAEERSIPREAFEFQMLYGMAEPAKRALGEMGYPVRDYAPVGELLPGMAYLVRRLLENSSNEGFLRRNFVDNMPRGELLRPPEAYGEPSPPPEGTVPGPFRNEPPIDFSIPEQRYAFREAIERVRGDLGREYPAVVGGRDHRTEERIVSENPARPGEIVGVAHGVGPELGEHALSIAREAQRDWGRRKASDRAEVLFRAAEIARSRRKELAAWQVVEVGKGWAEADADVDEAIDHLEYYGREMIRLGKPARLGDYPGEDNRYFYRPRGVGLVIAPWNFPLAISMGMVSAALVTGNAVLFKPSSLSVVNGWLAFSVLREAGVPEGVLHFVPGRGAVMGGHLVAHRDTDFVLFTGSREVGLSIIEKAGRTAPGQRGVKKAVAEMGGKNAIIVDDDADLDQAVPAVVRSAFGYQGQKCSACSRVVVLAACYDRFLLRLVEAVRSIPVGDPQDPAHFMGPVIDAKAKERIEGYIEDGRREGKIEAEIPVPAEGHYVSPVVLTGLPPDSRVLREEIFGPVLSVIRARDFGEALAVANDSDYALTGGVFSRSPVNIERSEREFEVGNLYINRGITGAIVGRQPFGGFKMSGVGSKAGGFDYLLQFLEPRVMSENTMRRGFTPEGMT
jgi:RHH-type proline utilization regulon transcriptional repressor/proline dehydrogenase/delta 1-pyrroline-5-carboxylate dehydrogenase